MLAVPRFPAKSFHIWSPVLSRNGISRYGCVRLFSMNLAIPIPRNAACAMHNARAVRSLGSIAFAGKLGLAEVNASMHKS